MSSSRQNRLIIVLAGILVAALLAAGAVIFLMPPDSSPFSFKSSPLNTNIFSKLNPFSPDSTPLDSSLPPETSSFDITPINRRSYTELNTTLINNGLLPVRPDPAAGKANPFL